MGRVTGDGATSAAGRTVPAPRAEARGRVPPLPRHHVPRSALLAGWEIGPGLFAAFAPAGFGKTALLAEQAGRTATSGTAVRWVTLTGADNDVARLRRSVAHVVSSLTLEAGDGGPAAVFFDDVHRIEAPAAISEFVELCNRAAVRISVFVAGRFEPPTLLTAARLAGTLHLVTSRELAFDRDGVAGMLRSTGVDLTPAVETAVWETTAGWPGAVGLVARALDGAGPIADPALVEARSAQVLDLVRGEFIAGLPGAERRALRALALPDVVTPELAHAITPGSDGPGLLAELARRGYPIEVGDRRDELIVHPLLRRALLVPDWTDMRYTERAARLAVDWFTARGRPFEAVAAAARGGDPALICRAFGANVGELVLTADLRELLALVDRVPSDAPGYENIRALRVALACIGGHAVAGPDFVGQVEAATTRGTVGLLDGAVAVSHAVSSVRGIDAMMATAVAALHVAYRGATTDAQRAAAAMYLAIARGCTDDLPSALATVRVGMEHAGIAGLPAAAVPFAFLEVDLLAWSGRHGDAIAAIGAAEAVSARFGIPAQFHRISTTARQIVLYSRHLRGELSEADRVTCDSLAIGAATRAVSRLTSAVPRIDDSVVADVPTILRPVLRTVAVETVWLLVRAGRTATARRYLHAVRARLGETRETLVGEAITVAATEPATAARLLAPAVAADAGQAGDAGTRVWANLLLARLAQQRGDAAEAAARVAAAADLAAPERVIRPFLHLPELRPVLDGNAGRFGAEEWLIERVRATMPTCDAPAAGLSPTELGVLRELAGLGGLEQIAARRHVSINTTKTQVRAVYRKLGVSSRRDAVAAGRARGLI